MIVNEQVAVDHGLKKDEYAKICELLKRTPNITELGIFSAMWNEHCSYKSSKLHLKKLPTKGKKVIHQTLDGMGFEDVNEVRQGKYFEIDTKETDNDKAKAKVEEMCKKLLANLVIENYKIIDPK